MWETEADIPEIIEFLSPLAAQSMFPLANLRNHGLNKQHRHSPNFWLTRRDGKVTDILTITQGGLVLPQCPSMEWNDLHETLAKRDLTGIIGPADQSRSFLSTFGLDLAPKSLDQDEPQYELILEDLLIPDGSSDIFPLATADKEEMIRWRYEYELETLNMRPEDARPTAERDYDSYCSAKSHVVLREGAAAVCTTGFNARLPDIVQIGGVYTPPNFRRRGHARRAVALHLQQAKFEGVKRATLFSANEYAARAYQAIGFTYVGEWTLCLFDGKQRVHD